MRRVAALVLGVLIASLGLFWFLQGAGAVHVRPLLCVSHCEPIQGKSTPWQVIGAVTFVVGAVVAGLAVRRLVDSEANRPADGSVR